MTIQQAAAFAIIGGAVVFFAWGRFRYDLVALVALLAGIIVGIVPAKQAFSGFTSDVVVIIASALVISAAVARSGVAELLLRPLLSRLRTPQTQVVAFSGATALLSMLTKNVGALAILMPVALRVSRTSRTSPSSILMPMAFLSLLGGLVTLVGTSTNIIASQVREETLGRPFAMFDFAPVGLSLTAVGLIFVAFAWRALPRRREGNAGLDDVTAGAVLSMEARLPEDWPDALGSVADLQLAGEHVSLTALIQENGSQVVPLPDARLSPGAILILEGDSASLDRLFARLPLVPSREKAEIEKEEPKEEMRSVEAVLQSDSPLVGTSAQRLRLQQEYGVKLLAVGRTNERISERLRDLVFHVGDVLVLQAGERALPSALKDIGALPLVERHLKLERARRRLMPVAVLAGAIALVALKLTPVATAFFGAAVLVVILGALSMREAYGALEPEVLILIGALTPLSEAVRATGGTDLIAAWLASQLTGMAPLVALGTLMTTALLCSPFLHNAPTVLVLAPIGVALAHRLNLNPDPFLMAVATGAGCDFLTPIGHQCNTLVWSPGGYRFGDYWRLGLPLSFLVIALGAPLIAYVWPLKIADARGSPHGHSEHATAPILASRPPLSKE